MLLPTIVFLALAFFLFIINIRNKRHLDGLKAGLFQLFRVLPVILLAFVLAGMIEVIIPGEFISQWLGKEAGYKGILLGTLGGTLLAMGPYASFPIIASVYGAGAGLGTVVSFISGWCLLGLSRIPYELGFLGPRFVFIRLSISVPFCIAAGIIAHAAELLVL